MHTILIPGLACSARSCDILVRTAASYGATTIADTRSDSSVEAMAERLLAGAPPRFVLAGVSMGGCVALEVVRRAPERVLGLALISTTAVPDTEEQRQLRQLQLDMAQSGKFGDLIAYALPTLVDPGNQHDHAVLDLGASMAHEIGPEIFLTQLQALIDRPDPRCTLARINCPTAVIHGAGDQIFPLPEAREMAASIPTAQLTVVDNAGHAAAQERPGAVGEALHELMQRVRAGHPA